VRAGSVTVEAGKLTRALLPLRLGAALVQARRADGELLLADWEIFPAGRSDTPFLAGSQPGPHSLPSGRYDVRFRLGTGEERWRKDVAVDEATVLIEEEFPAKNLVVRSGDAELNGYGSGFQVGIFARGGTAPIGWCRLGTGARLAPGSYDLLLASSKESRQGIWRRDVAVADAAAEIVFDVQIGFLLADTVPQLRDARGEPAVQVAVYRAGTDEKVAEGPAGLLIPLPEGTYDAVLRHDGLYGRIEEKMKSVAIRVGRSTARQAILTDRFGYAEVRNDVTVLQNGAPVAKYGSGRIPLPPGRFSFRFEDRVAVGEQEIYRGRTRAIEAWLPKGTLVFLGQGRYKVGSSRECWAGRTLVLPEGIYDVLSDSGTTVRVTVRASESTIVGE
jgi:hypothetical protein